jgi:hypothetical protein
MGTGTVVVLAGAAGVPSLAGLRHLARRLARR